MSFKEKEAEDDKNQRKEENKGSTRRHEWYGSPFETESTLVTGTTFT